MAQQPVELILARQLASSLASAVLLVDASGDTVYFNEPAELILGRRFDEVDELPFEERSQTLAPLRPDGTPMPTEELPGRVAVREHRPAHATFHLHGFDGVVRLVEATAIPLESARGRALGALVVVWPVSPAPAGGVAGDTTGG